MKFKELQPPKRSIRVGGAAVLMKLVADRQTTKIAATYTFIIKLYGPSTLSVIFGKCNDFHHTTGGGATPT